MFQTLAHSRSRSGSDSLVHTRFQSELMLDLKITGNVFRIGARLWARRLYGRTSYKTVELLILIHTSSCLFTLRIEGNVNQLRKPRHVVLYMYQGWLREREDESCYPALCDWWSYLAPSGS